MAELTIAKLKALREALRGNDGPPSDHCYMDRATWIQFGGRPEDFDALPTVDLEKEPGHG